MAEILALRKAIWTGWMIGFADMIKETPPTER